MNPARKAVIAVAMVGSSLAGGALGAAIFAGTPASAATTSSTTPLPCSWALGNAGASGSPAVPVWLITPCRFDGLGGVAAGMVGCVNL